MAPFSTFFGDYLHGLWVTWESNSDGNAQGTTGFTDSATWDVDKFFMFYVAWSNPNSAESVTKDGIYLLAKCVLVAGATIADDEPTLTCAYTALDSDGTTTHVNDIKPVAN